MILNMDIFKSLLKSDYFKLVFNVESSYFFMLVVILYMYLLFENVIETNNVLI